MLLRLQSRNIAFISTFASYLLVYYFWFYDNMLSLDPISNKKKILLKFLVKPGASIWYWDCSLAKNAHLTY